jgi:hypothetical protein
MTRPQRERSRSAEHRASKKAWEEGNEEANAPQMNVNPRRHERGNRDAVLAVALST